MVDGDGQPRKSRELTMREDRDRMGRDATQPGDL
jgi:hypothetical protein